MPFCFNLYNPKFILDFFLNRWGSSHRITTGKNLSDDYDYCYLGYHKLLLIIIGNNNNNNNNNNNMIIITQSLSIHYNSVCFNCSFLTGVSTSNCWQHSTRFLSLWKTKNQNIYSICLQLIYLSYFSDTFGTIL